MAAASDGAAAVCNAPCPYPCLADVGLCLLLLEAATLCRDVGVHVVLSIWYTRNTAAHTSAHKCTTQTPYLVVRAVTTSPSSSALPTAAATRRGGLKQPKRPLRNPDRGVEGAPAAGAPVLPLLGGVGSGEGMRVGVTARMRVVLWAVLWVVAANADGIREMATTGGAAPGCVLLVCVLLGCVLMHHCASALPNMGVSRSVSWAAGV